MAYHYIVNIDTGEKRTILSASLPTYNALAHFRIFDTVAERDAFIIPEWWAYNLGSSENGPTRISAATAASRWHRSYLIQGWCLASSEADARAAFAARPPPRYWINEADMAVNMIPYWLDEETRAQEWPHYHGDYASLAEGRAALPQPLVCMNSDGEFTTCAPSQRYDRERNGYIVRANREECRDALPVRYQLDGNTYRRIRLTGRGARTPSMFAQLRGAVRAMKLEEDVFYARAVFRGNVAVAVNTALFAVYQNFLTRHREQVYSDNPVYNATMRRSFITRLNVMVGREYAMECPDCNNALCFANGAQVNGRYICSNCRERYVACGDCGVLMLHEDSREDSRGNTRCQAHWRPIIMDPNGGMLGYSTDVTRRLGGFLTAKGEKSDPKKIWLGWELECHAKGDTSSSGSYSYDEDCEDCGGGGWLRDEEGDDTDDRCGCGVKNGDRTAAVRRVAQAANQWCIVKEDSSLDNGMEIVSVPASLRWHRENVAPFLQEAQTFLSGWQHNDCGIHVHVGRKQLSELQQSKMVRFMHHLSNQSFITAVAGRDPNSYCVRGGVKSFGAFKSENTRGRYQALNFATRNNKTIEFRIFRSNVSPAGFMKNLEFVHALCQWAKFSSARDLESGALIEYAKRERDAYPSLVRFFESNGTLPAPKRHPDAPAAPLYIAA